MPQITPGARPSWPRPSRNWRRSNGGWSSVGSPTTTPGPSAPSWSSWPGSGRPRSPSTSTAPASSSSTPLCRARPRTTTPGSPASAGWWSATAPPPTWSAPASAPRARPRGFLPPRPGHLRGARRVLPDHGRGRGRDRRGDRLRPPPAPGPPVRGGGAGGVPRPYRRLSARRESPGVPSGWQWRQMMITAPPHHRRIAPDDHFAEGDRRPLRRLEPRTALGGPGPPR